MYLLKVGFEITFHLDNTYTEGCVNATVTTPADNAINATIKSLVWFDDGAETAGA